MITSKTTDEYYINPGAMYSTACHSGNPTGAKHAYIASVAKLPKHVAALEDNYFIFVPDTLEIYFRWYNEYQDQFCWMVLFYSTQILLFEHRIGFYHSPAVVQIYKYDIDDVLLIDHANNTYSECLMSIYDFINDASFKDSLSSAAMTESSAAHKQLFVVDFHNQEIFLQCMSLLKTCDIDAYKEVRFAETKVFYTAFPSPNVDFNGKVKSPAAYIMVDINSFRTYSTCISLLSFGTWPDFRRHGYMKFLMSYMQNCTQPRKPLRFMLARRFSEACKKCLKACGFKYERNGYYLK